MNKKQSVFFFLFLSVLTLDLTVGQNSWAINSCREPGRDVNLCYDMKHLRGLLNILDSQRDLMQFNYPLIKESALDLSQVLNSVLVRNGADEHIGAIKDLRTQALLLVSQATRNSSETHLTIGKLSSACIQCHANSNPPSGHNWNEISSGFWATLTRNCNAPGHHSYACRSMYGMMMGIDYFEVSSASGKQSFEMTTEVSREIYRIAKDLAERHIVHDENLSFDTVIKDSLELASFSNQKAPETFDKSRELRTSCMKCHGEH